MAAKKEPGICWFGNDINIVGSKLFASVAFLSSLITVFEYSRVGATINSLAYSRNSVYGVHYYVVYCYLGL